MERPRKTLKATGSTEVTGQHSLHLATLASLHISDNNYINRVIFVNSPDTVTANKDEIKDKEQNTAR